MKNQQAPALREGSSVGADGSVETRSAWNGPRFELDDGPNVNVSLGIRRTLSALVLTSLIVVGGVGFFHKILPKIIEANKAEQAAKAKKPAVKNDRPAADEPADMPEVQPEVAEAANEEMRELDEEQRQAVDDALNSIQDQLQENLQGQYQEFIERRRRRFDETIDGSNRIVPDNPEPIWKALPRSRRKAI
jgi:hypothetical protein